MSKLTAKVIAQPHLFPHLCPVMYELYRTYYDGTSENFFWNDLSQKDYAILLWNPEGQLGGFSTLSILSRQWEGDRIRAIFSGDTIIHRQYWGEQTLPLAWCRLAGQIKAQHPHTPLYWFLIVKGYRTYRYLPLFAKVFYPTYRYPTPPPMQAIADALATQKFGEYYNPKTGLIRFPTSRGHLRGNWADIKAGIRKKPDVRYFLERNPDYYKGDELVCLMELRESNLRSHARRGFLAGLQHPL
ncbi:hypothetical protein [Phormidium sp. CCY1219]|uniref:hypothetical protein n=1 Tax=Phormidium sp. CCY1219 TaxID=2886104 RepID=UPI002D1EEAE5|nr:hypothetical protein [Phormidium sp. CCY1219]MEB3830535.1 hypothetical protein [Phormidium sp. CCY1219]